VLAAATPPLVAISAYHWQQAAEKLLKAMLIAAGVIAPRTHDVDALSVLVVAQYPGLAPSLMGLGPLTGWAVAPRYPDTLELDPIQLTDVVDALAIVEGVRGLVRDILRPI
jgi:HEPN domain-containing protein